MENYYVEIEKALRVNSQQRASLHNELKELEIKMQEIRKSHEYYHSDRPLGLDYSELYFKREELISRIKELEGQFCPSALWK